MIVQFLQKFLPNTPLRKVANVRNMNRIANILDHLTGEGCTIRKPLNHEGRGWVIEVPPYYEAGFDRYAAVNDDDDPAYLEDQFAAMTAEQTPTGKNGNVAFQVIDVSGDKKIAADVRHDYSHGLEKDSTDPDAPTLRVRRQHSVVFDDGKLQLDGDAASPGNSKYYGTSGAGAKGFHSLPSDSWGDLVDPPVKILAKDAAGTIGWIPIADVCGYCETEWCPDLADEYTLAYTNEVWIVDDSLKYFDGNPPPSPATFVRVGSSCEYTLADIRTRSFDKLHFDRSACLTASDSGTTYTLKRDAGATRWEVWEGAVLLGWNNDASAPDAGVWTANTAEAGGYAGTYEEGGAIANCGYTDETAGIKVLTIGVS